MYTYTVKIKEKKEVLLEMSFDHDTQTDETMCDILNVTMDEFKKLLPKKLKITITVRDTETGLKIAKAQSLKK